MLTQVMVAEHLDMSQPAVSGWLERLGLDVGAVSLDDIRIAYIRALREQAAGRAAMGDLDLATERARLAREQADKIAMQNAVTRRELAPVHIIEQVLTRAGSRVAAILEALPGAIKRRLPTLGADDIALIQREIAQARNVVAALSIDDIVEPEPGAAEDPPQPAEGEAT